MTIHVSDQWGPFALSLDPAERIARCRGLRAIVHLCAGPRGQETADLLRRAERDPAALSDASHALNRMAAKDRRHVWASYAVLSRPA